MNPGPDERDGAKRKRPQGVSPEGVEVAKVGSGADTTDPLSDVGSFRDDEERALIALFRVLSPARQETVLKLARAIEPVAAATGAAAEEGRQTGNRARCANAERDT